MMHVELQAICSALGYQEGSKYLKEPDCLESVKDLIRFLKHEDDTLEIRRQLGDAEILQNDLVPLVVQYKTDRILFESVIRLMVNLTQPARLCFNDVIPTDKTARNYYIEVEVCLRKYKRAFADEELFAVLTEKLGALLKLDWEHRHEEDRLLIERLLILVRNILIVPSDPDEEKRTDDDASLHDQLLWALHVSGMEDLLLYLANSDEERQYCMHTLEIISLMFREQSAEMLAHVGIQRAVSEKEKDVQQLEIIREQELTEKKDRIRKLSSRHSRFGGTYLLKNVKSISEKDVIYHRKLDQVSKHSFDITKKPQKIAKNRAPIKDIEVVRRSTLSIRLCLKEFCVQFLENCYNLLMSAVKDNLVREKAQAHDETYYLWAIRFFMEFCRLHSGQVELVCETLNVPTFHYIQVNLFNYYEMILTEKKEAIVWARRVHLALKAYQELLQTLHAMDNSKNSHLISSSKVIKTNIFYMMEFRDIFVTLLSKFEHSKHSTSYLTDLVHTTHLFLKMLERFCTSNRHMVVQTKKKSNKKRKAHKEANAAAKFGQSQLSEEQLLELWDDISGELSAIVGTEGLLSTDVLPFDAASEVDVDQQKADAMLRIQRCLRGKKLTESVALFRAAREVWPEKNEFGAADIAAEEEFMALREIFLAELAQPPDTVHNEEADFEEEEEFNEIEEEEMSAVITNEQELNFKEFVSKFAKPAILKNYTLLLSNFKTNSTHTNHCTIKMMHRIAVDLKQEGMLFQASLFCIFRKIFALSRVKHFQEMVKFARFIINKFIPAAQENKKIFMEILFWKTSREAAQMVTGYMNDSADPSSHLWTEDQKMELERLFEETKQNTEQDALSYIMAHITDENKSRRQVLRQLRLSELIESAKDLKAPAPKTSDRSPWTEEQEEELKRVFEEVRNLEDPFGNLLENLSFKKPKNWIKDKLFSLDLIQDKKELRKKRSKTSRKKKNSLNDEDEEESDENEQCNNEEEEENWQESTVFPYSSEEEDSSKISATSQPSNKEVNNTNESGLVPVVDVNIEQVLQRLVEHGYAAQIKWIQRSLQRTSDDRKEPGEYLGVPIVPLTEDNENAMDDPDFLHFLELIGLSRPVVGQEAFWRIGGELSFAELNQIIEGLTLDENSQPVNIANLKSWLSKRNSKLKSSKANSSKCKDSKLASKNSKRKIAMTNLVKKQKKEPKNSDSCRKNKGQRHTKKKNDKNPNLEKKERKKKKFKMAADEFTASVTEEAVDEFTASVTEEQSDSDSNLGRRSGKTGKKRKFLVESSDDSVDDEPLISQVKVDMNKDKGNADSIDGENRDLERHHLEMSDSDSDSDRLVVDEDVGSPPKKRKIAKRVLSDDDDDDDDTNNERSLSKSFSPLRAVARKRLRILESDDDDDDYDKENHQVESNVPPLTEASKDPFDIAKNVSASKSFNQVNVPMSVETPATCSNTDSFPATLMSLPQNHSDSEIVDDYITLSTVVKKKQRLFSDEDEN